VPLCRDLGPSSCAICGITYLLTYFGAPRNIHGARLVRAAMSRGASEPPHVTVPRGTMLKSVRGDRVEPPRVAARAELRKRQLSYQHWQGPPREARICARAAAARAAHERSAGSR
jgi:hypothetical protein